MSHRALYPDDTPECTWFSTGCCSEKHPHLRSQRHWLQVTAHLVCVCAASAELWMGTKGCALRRHRVGSEMRAIYSTARLHWSTEREREDFPKTTVQLNNLRWHFPVNLLQHGEEKWGHQQHVSSKANEEPLQIHRGDTANEEGYFFTKIPSMQTRAGKGEGVSPGLWHTVVFHWATKVMTHLKSL